MANEKDILSAAIAATEVEIFGDAFGKEEVVLDETGDTSLEAMGQGLEGQLEDEEDKSETEGDEEGKEKPEQEADASKADKAKLEAEAADKAKTETETQRPEGRVPAGRLREQTERVKTAEAEREALKAQLETERANFAKQTETLNAKFDGVLAALQRQQTPAAQIVPPKADEPPDLFEDPKAFADFITKGFQSELQKRDKEMQDMRVETSMQVAHARHGDSFAKAFDAVKTLDPRNPDDQTAVRRIYAAPNPGEALVQWHKRNEVLREVGNDPAKYRESVAAQTREALMKDPEFRRQLLEDLRADAETGDHGQPRTLTRLPRSLNGAAGNSRGTDDHMGSDGSERSVFDSAFNSS